MDHRAFPPDLRRRHRDHVFRDRLCSVAASHRPCAGKLRPDANPALAVVHRHDRHHVPVALRRHSRHAAPHGVLRLRQSGDLAAGVFGVDVGDRRLHSADLGHPVPHRAGPWPAGRDQRGGGLPVCGALAHAGADPGRAEQLWAVACADDRANRRQLRLSDRAVDGAERNQRARGLCRSEPMSEQPLFSVRNPWFNASVGVTAVIAVLAALAGLIWLPLAQPDLKLSGIWDAICSAAGVPRASSQADSIKPDFKTSNVVMTSEMLTRHDQVSIGSGATLAQHCAICHGPQGVSDANSPNLAGQFAAVTWKELNDFKTGARFNVVMSPFAATLSNQDMLDIAAYYAYLPRVPSNKLDLTMPAPGIVTLGAPMRNIAPCGSCHGDIDNKAGSPWLGGQSAVYIKAQLQALAAGTRRNDISQQMRNIARQMTAEEIDQVARYYEAQP